MKLRLIVIATAALLATWPGASGQTAPVASSLVFEVASVKRSPPSDVLVWKITGGPGTKSPGQFSCANAPLRALLLRAYGLRPNQLAGPASLDNDKFDIAAKIPVGSTKEQVNEMLRNLLVERIGLAAHTETRDLPSHELTIAKRGLKMKKAEEAQAGKPSDPLTTAPGSPKVSIGADGLPALAAGTPMWISVPEGASSRLVARMQSLPSLVTILENHLGQPVNDNTGLIGSYDFTLLYAPGPTEALPPSDTLPSESTGLGARDPVPDLVAAVESQLGLKLQLKKIPGNVLVVDRYSRTSSAN